MIRRLFSWTPSSAVTASRARFAFALAAMLVVAGLLPGVAAAASTWVVNNTGDDGVSVCPSFSSCELRGALANAISGDTITFDPSLNGQTITLASGPLAIADKNLTIVGNGAGKITISGGNGANASRLFNITSSASLSFPTMTVSLSGLTLTNGTAGVNASGGALYISKPNSNTTTLNVNLDSVVVSNNTAGTPANSTYSQGGGIYSQRAVLRITNSTISGNTAYGFSANGGGILATGSYSSGGIAANGNTLVIINSTITGNSAIDVTSSSVPTGGGVEFAFGSATILNTTIDNNTAVHGANLHNGNASTPGFPFTLKNSIVANANGSDAAGPNISGPISDAEYDLIDNDAAATYPGTKIAVITGQNPNLGTLGANGGPTPTQVLAAGSPAINAGDPAGCKDDAGNLLTRDQRGSVRPAQGVICDLGAYERFDLALTPTTLPAATVATPYSATVNVAASQGGVTYAVTAGSLGPYTLTASTGVISGNTNVASTLNFTITATDSLKNSGSRAYVLVINGGPANTLVVDSFPSPTIAGVAHNVKVTAKDVYGNIANLYNNTIYFSSSDPQANLPPSYTFVAADNGVHTFSATLKTAGTQSIKAADFGMSGTQSGIVVNSAAASTMTLGGYPSPIVAGAGATATLTLRDAFGNVATGYTGTVHFSSSDGAATLPGDYTFVAADAGAHILNVTLKTAGSQSINAIDTVNAALTSTQSGIAVTPAPAATFTVSGYPSPVTAGVAGNFTVTAFDAYGNTATNYVGSMHFTSSDGNATLPADSGLSNGTGTFSATLRTAGAQSITATDAVMSVTGTQGGIVVNPAAASTLVVAGYPSPVTAGTSNGFSVTAKDAFGNTATGYAGTVHVTSSDSAAVLPADSVLTNGLGLFNATLKTTGTQSITATDTVNGALAGTQSGIVVNPGAATSFVVSGYPASITAGTAHAFTVTAKDGSGNTATGYTGSVHFTSSDGAATLPADAPLANGTGTFNATLKTAGTQSLTATDTATSSITGAQSGIVVNAAAFSALSVSGYPSPVVAGTSNSLGVAAKDAYGNTITAYVGSVHFSASDAQAVLPADYAFTALDNGVHTFNNVTLKTAGTQSITATDAAASVTGTQSGIVVNPAAASALVVGGYPSPVVAGNTNIFNVTAKDAFGNIATGYAGSVHFTSTDGGAALPADYTFVATDNGVHAFNATLRTAGTQSISATDTVTSSLAGTQSGIVVNPGAATSFVVAYPTSVTAGTSHNVTVTAKDALGNVAAGYSGTVHFTSSDGAAVLPADAPLSGGVGTFSAMLKTAGSQSLTATDTVVGSITGTQGGIVVSAAAAVTLQVSGYASPTTAGASHGFNVTAKDAFGNIATAYAGTVHFISGDAAAALPADSTLSNGIGTFSATLKTSGTQSITATDTVTGSITGAQTVVVNAGGAATFVVSGYPSPITAGTSNSFGVVAKDTFGNTATGYAGTVHFASSDGAAVLPANATLANGAGTFSATLKTAGTQTITATDTVTASITGVQNNIVVNAGAAATLAVSGYPSPITAGASNSFSVTAKDASGNTATTYAGTVHFTSSDSAAVLSANATLTNGVGTFSATLKTSGTQSISATDTVTASITGVQNNIVVNAGVVTKFIVSGYPSPVTAGTSNGFSVTAKDAFGNTATGYAGTIHVTSSDGAAVLPADSTLTNGLGLFNATLKTVGTQSISAVDTADSTLIGTQSAITVNPGATVTLVVAAYPSPTTAGVAHSFSVTAKDASGNVTPAYTGTVHFTSSDGAATLPANATLTNGVGTFSATLKTAGTQSLTATDAATSSITGAQSGIVVNAAATTTLAVTGYPSPAVAGASNSVTVTAQDAFGNVVTGYAGTVHFTSTDGQAALPANYSFTALDNGVHTIGVTLKTAGTQSITATDTVTASITGTQGGIVVNAAAATSLVVSGYPSPARQGSSNPFTVTVKDTYGNTATTYLGTVHFTSSDAQAVLPADYGFVAGDNGTHAFTATFKTAGTQSITATDTVTGSITGTQSGIVVKPMYTVTASVNGGNGTIAPPTQTIDAGTIATVTMTPGSGYHTTIDPTTTCPGGTLSGNTYTTASINADCTIVAAFVADAPPSLAITISDGRSYARYGMLLNYTVTVTNSGAGDATGVSLANAFPPQLDVANTTWICIGAGGGATCTASGSGVLQDSGVSIPAGRSLTWLVTAPILPNAIGATVDNSVSVSGGGSNANATDSDILVIYRDGFDVPYGDGTANIGASTAVLASCPADPAPESFGDSAMRTFTVPTLRSDSPVDTLLVARTDVAAGFRVERLNLGVTPRVRLVVIARDGSEHASAWVATTAGAALAIATADAGEGGRVLLLEGAASPLALPLPAGFASTLLIQTQPTAAGVCQ